MDEFNYLQFLSDDNDLLAAEKLPADDFPTFAVSFNQVVADFFPNIAAVPHGLESTGAKTKKQQQQQQQRNKTKQQTFQDFLLFQTNISKSSSLLQQIKILLARQNSG